MGISIEPRKGRHTVDVSIMDALMLQQFHGFQVPLNKMVVLSTPLLKELSLSLSFGLRIHRSFVVDILKCLPMLLKLTIRRIDDVVGGEAIDALDHTFVGLSDIPCVRSSLQQFVIKNCRGGRTELDIIRFILLYASQLKQLRIELDKTCSSKTSLAVQTEVREVSLECQLIAGSS